MHQRNSRLILSVIALTLCFDASTPLVAQSEMSEESTQDPWSVHSHTDSLQIHYLGEPVAEYMFADPQIKRPYFANIKTLGGILVSRNHPPIEGTDATDHATMHPGIWIGFGDINGVDFWRNQGTIEHLRFTQEPEWKGQTLRFSTESLLKDSSGNSLGMMQCRFAFMGASERTNTQYSSQHRELPGAPETLDGWMLVWEMSLTATETELVFGDQEEMGFGVRVSTPLTEKSGGAITNSLGQKTAAATWGQAADWCEYSGSIDGQPCGVLMMADGQNFRECWWHNRDYGLMVANPFGRRAMNQGERSEVRIAKGDSLTLRFGAIVHGGTTIDQPAHFRSFQEARDP